MFELRKPDILIIMVLIIEILLYCMYVRAYVGVLYQLMHTNVVSRVPGLPLI